MSSQESGRGLPTAALVCLTVSFLGVLATLAALAITGSDATEFSRFLNTALNLALLVLSSGSLAYSARAQKQTNGALDSRIRQSVTEALDSQRANDTLPGGELRR